MVVSARERERIMRKVCHQEVGAGDQSQLARERENKGRHGNFFFLIAFENRDLFIAGPTFTLSGERFLETRVFDSFGRCKYNTWTKGGQKNNKGLRRRRRRVRQTKRVIGV